jgi:16S rRNA (guanine527-N7)-methyltransferase
VPISIARPDLSVTLLEPRGKRASFLRHVVRTVPVENAQVLAERIEDLVSPDYDAASCRAVGDLAEMIDGASFLAPGGLLLAWTTEPQQLAEALAPHFSLDQSDLLPGTDRRSIALFRKQS